MLMLGCIVAMAAINNKVQRVHIVDTIVAGKEEQWEIPRGECVNASGHHHATLLPAIDVRLRQWGEQYKPSDQECTLRTSTPVRHLHWGIFDTAAASETEGLLTPIA